MQVKMGTESPRCTISEGTIHIGLWERYPQKSFSTHPLQLYLAAVYRAQEDGTKQAAGKLREHLRIVMP